LLKVLIRYHYLTRCLSPKGSKPKATTMSS